MDLTLYSKLIVKQKVEMLEAFTGIETKNKYDILTTNAEKLFFAYEQSNIFARLILKRMRPLNLFIIDNNKTNFIKIEKRFAFIYPNFEIFDSSNQLIGSIKTKFGITSKIEIYDTNFKLIFYAKNQIMHPWNFNIYLNKDSQDSQGLITKKWTGIGKELFTDSDNFLIDYNKISDENNKKIILALALIIDLFVFEK